MVPGALLAAVLALGAPVADFPRGQVVERITCAKAPGQSYALYLPTGYTPERNWPVLYLLDPRGRALVPLERFQAAAEEFGWILASSYNSASDTKEDFNAPAMTAMWNDVVTRFAVDGRRVYATGFSGTGRAATGMAYALPGRIAGVIGAGAGFEDSEGPVREKPPFLYFGTIGDRDMNYYEMRSLEEKLAGAKATYRIAYFSGGHEWMPEALARESVAWMELHAMRAGIRPKDDARVASLQQAAFDRARALEAEGRLTEAAAAWAHAAEDFRGFADEAAVRAAEAKAEEIRKSPAVRDAGKEAKKRDARDRAALRTSGTKVRAALAAADPPLPAALSAELGIPALRKKAASDPDPEERLSAQRILANLRAQTSFYLPEQMLEQRDPTRGRMLLSVAAEIDPDNPLVYYNLAAYAARSGDASRAMKDLETAVARGFTRFELIDGDADFDPIRENEIFRKWLAAARTRPSS